MSTYEFQHLNEESRDNWSTNADYWDQRMGEGNDFHLELLEPTQLPLLDLQPDELVLDVACGNGQFARKMAQLGARVIATDISERMIANAQARTRERRPHRVQGRRRHQQGAATGARRGTIRCVGVYYGHSGYGKYRPAIRIADQAAEGWRTVCILHMPPLLQRQPAIADAG